MQPEDLVGQTLGHYRIKRQIGYGGMAMVFLGEDIHLNREVALKVFWPRLGETQDFLRRFAREARVLAQLDHPHILQVYDYGEQDELAFLVTPYLSGGSLKAMLRTRKALPPSEAIELLLQVLPALQYAHDRNLIHRDIKPDNLLFKGDGSLVLADFGLVKVVEGEQSGDTLLHTRTESGQTIAGTPEYMAPEQIEGHAVAASDIYSLGIILYEMVTGSRPFGGDSLLSILMKQINEPARSPRELNPTISPRLERVIQRAIAKDPLKRFASPLDFQQALTQLNNPISNPGIAGFAQSIGEDKYATQEAQAASSVGRAEVRTPIDAIGGDTHPMPEAQPHPRPLATSSRPQSATDNAQASGRPLTPLPPVQANEQRHAAFSPTRADGRLLTPLPMDGGGEIATPPVQPQAQMWGMSQTVPPMLTPTPPYAPPRRSRTPVVVLSLLVVLLAGLIASLFLTPMGHALFASHATLTPTVSGMTPTIGITPTARGGVPATPGTTRGMPPTSTTCPASGQARPAVMEPLELGTARTIVYLTNTGESGDNSVSGTLQSYNTVTGATTEIKRMSGTRINEAQISDDGQWVLFAATINGRDQLRLVRMDGQGLQTLLCAQPGRGIRGSQLSIDQQYVIFDEEAGGGAVTTFLLNLNSGELQAEIVPANSGLAFLPRTWLDGYHVVMSGLQPGSGTQQNIYVLDISKGANQSASDLSRVFIVVPGCWDFDSSYDARSLFITQCKPGQPGGTSTIVQQQVNGGNPKTVLHSSALTFNTVRVINDQSTALLAVADNSNLSAAQSDPAHDGLYFIKTDGSTPRLLVKTSSGQQNQLCPYSQYYWANVSRDFTLYALDTVTPGTNTYTLSYGSLSSGKPTVFTSSTKGTVTTVVGWTTT